MKNLGIKKKNLIAFALAAILAVGGIGVYQSQAAEKIDATKQCTLTVVIPDSYKLDNGSKTVSNLISEYDGEITINLYKVADVTLEGNLESKIDGLDFSALQGDDVDVDTVKDLAKTAYEKVDKTATHPVVKLNPKNNKKSEKINLDRGLYLYVPEACENSRYKFSADKYLVSVPSSDYIAQSTSVDANGNVVTTTSTSDEWKYDISIAIKYQAKQRLGDLVINKTLTTFNESLGNAAFVYSVVAKIGNETVHNNVYTMNFGKSGTQSITVHNIPATATVTVTEIYSGASYEIKPDATKATQTATIVASDLVGKKDADGNEIKGASVSFTNDFDDHLLVGGLSVTNSFAHHGDKIYWYNQITGGDN